MRAFTKFEYKKSHKRMFVAFYLRVIFNHRLVIYDH